MGFEFVTATAGSVERLAYWNRLIEEHHGYDTCEPVRASDFKGRIFVHDLGPAQISTVHCDPASYQSTAVGPLGQHRDHFLLHLAQGGRTDFESRGVSIPLTRGDMLLMDMQQPFRMGFSCPGQYVTIRIARAELEEHILDPGALAWRPLSGREGLGALLRALVSETAAQEDIASADQSVMFGHLMAMLASCSRQGRLETVPELDTVRLDRAKWFMMSNLRDANLDARRVAAAVGLSVRSLYRLFSQDKTTFMRWLTARRMEASYSALAGGQCRDVTDAALSHGFKDLSHFSRSFRKRFRDSPRNVLRGRSIEADVYTRAFVRNLRGKE